METTPTDDDERLAGDLLVGADAIRAYLVHLGWPPDVDVYNLKRNNIIPIGKTSGSGGLLIGSKRRIARHSQKLAQPAS
jgi:hypothetical protein